jgi:hypothetical protein
VASVQDQPVDHDLARRQIGSQQSIVERRSPIGSRSREGQVRAEDGAVLQVQRPTHGASKAAEAALRVGDAVPDDAGSSP